MSLPRFIECPHCDSGYCYSGTDPDNDRRWRCDDCGGSGTLEIEDEPRTFEDLDEEDYEGALS